jgi:hypothetical protein
VIRGTEDPRDIEYRVLARAAALLEDVLAHVKRPYATD